MDLLSLHQVDNRRLKVVVDGLPLFQGAQLAIDITMVSSPERRDGPTPVYHNQRSSFGPSPEAEGADVPRVGAAVRSRPVCVLGL